MNDKDLRALAAKLLKHYVVEDEAVAKIVEAKPLERGEPKVIPMITAEERALLNMLGGPMAAAMEGRVISLAAQGCSCGCSCGCGDGDDGGGSAGGEGSAGSEGSAGNDGSASGFSDGSVGGETGAFGAAADAASDAASAAASGLAGDLGAAADAAAAATGATGDLGASTSADASGFGLSAGEAAGWGSLGDSLGAEGLAGLSGLADGPDGPDTGIVGLTNDSLTVMSPDELAAFMNAPQVDPGISPSAYSSLTAQNEALSDTLDAVNAGLDANAAAQSSAGTLGGLGSLGIGSALGELFGITSAQAAPTAPATSGVADVLDAAQAAAQQGQLGEFLASNPTAASVLGNYASEYANLQATNNAVLGAQGQQAIYGSQPGLALDPNANVYGELGPGPSSSVASAAPSTSNPFGDLVGPSAALMQQAELVGAVPAIGAGPNAAGFTSAPSQVATAPALGPAVDVPSLNTVNVGPVAAAPQVSQPTAMSATSTQPSYTGISAIDSKIANAIANPGQTAINLGVGLVPGVGIANTLSGLLGGPTVGGVLAGLASGTSPGEAPATGSDMGGGGGSEPPRGSTMAGSPVADIGSSLPSATNPVVTQEAILRRYLGAGTDLNRYGFGTERTYYSAEGGYFDADQYFANGGLVSPMQPPSQPTVPPYPTMAFTDGGGPVGSIAQPPGLAASDAYGSDAPHASPMAPSIAASVPTVQSGLTTLASRNVNASPAPSPIAQNPNVGYALGQSPLTNL